MIPAKSQVSIFFEKESFQYVPPHQAKSDYGIGMEMGMWKGHGKITLDDRERALEEIKKLKFIGQDKIKATTLVVELAPQ